MATPGRESPIRISTNVIGASTQCADTDMERAEGLAMVNGNAGKARTTHATPSIVTAAEILEPKTNEPRFRIEGLEALGLKRSDASNAAGDGISHMEWMVRQPAQEPVQLQQTVGHSAILLEAHAAQRRNC